MHVGSLRRRLEQKKTMTHTLHSISVDEFQDLSPVYTASLLIPNSLLYIFGKHISKLNRFFQTQKGGGVLKSTNVKVFRCDIYSCTLFEDVNR